MIASERILTHGQAGTRVVLDTISDGRDVCYTLEIIPDGEPSYKTYLGEDAATAHRAFADAIDEIKAHAKARCEWLAKHPDMGR